MKNKSVIWEWIICYIIILMIPIITIFVNYFCSVEVIKKDIYESNELVLNNLTNGVDAILAQEREFYEYILSCKDFSVLANRKEQDNWFDYYVKEVRSEAEGYSKWHKMSFVIYMFNTDYVIGKMGYSSSIYYRSLEQSVQKQITYSQWLQLLSAEYVNEFFVERYMDGRSDTKCIIYADSMQWGKSGKINMFISVPVSRIKQLTDGLKPGTVLVISTNGKFQLALSTEGVVEMPQTMYIYGETEKSFDTEKYMVISRESAEKNVMYYILVPQRDFWKEFRYVRELFWGSLILTFLVGVFCVMLMVRRNYRPLSSLYAKITNGAREGNEFRQIEKAYNMYVRENDIMRKKITSREEIVQNYYLMSLMKGWNVCRQSEEVPVSLLPNGKLVLIGFLIPFPEEQDGMLFFIVDNVFSELMRQEKLFRLEEGEYLFYLCGIAEVAGWKESCLKKLSFLQDFLEEKFGYSIFAAVSKLENDINQLRCQYLSVTEMLEYAKIIGANEAVDAEMRMQERGIIKEVIEYIELHYTESSLNVNSVADGLNRSAKYISKIFKEETGKSILEYIHGLRIRKAQRLILSGKYSLEEVYVQVGYVNDATFRRAFVKIVGVIPSEYKKSLE